MDEYEQESGQLLVDKRRFYYHLQLAAWLGAQEYIRGLILGDKDLFRFSWHALKTQFGTPGYWLTSVGFRHPHTSNNGDRYCGVAFGQRFPNGELGFIHGGFFKHLTKPVIAYLKAHGGVWTTYKQSEHEQTPSYPEWTNWSYDMVDEIREDEGVQWWQCMDFTNITAKPLDNVLPAFEQLFEDLGGFWMLAD